MENFIKKESFLARWISDELSPEELKKFENSKDYPVLKKINDASQTLKAPTFKDQALLTKIKELNNKEPQVKVRKLIPNWAYSAAAVLVVALGFLYFINRSSQFNTGFGESLAVTLPDKSSVKLNANSKLEYKVYDWKADRVLHLEGEAFFDVEKGETFKVISSKGIVEVLGTEFNIITRDDYFEVQCTEGKVRVTSNDLNQDVILLPGKAVRVVNDNFEEWDFKLSEPNWTTGESTFYNAPINQVLTSLENQFKIEFDKSNIDLHKRFTGAFTHDNLNLALKTVSGPMGISYKFDKEKGLIILNSYFNN